MRGDSERREREVRGLRCGGRGGCACPRQPPPERAGVPAARGGAGGGVLGTGPCWSGRGIRQTRAGPGRGSRGCGPERAGGPGNTGRSGRGVLGRGPGPKNRRASCPACGAAAGNVPSRSIRRSLGLLGISSCKSRFVALGATGGAVSDGLAAVAGTRGGTCPG